MSPGAVTIVGRMRAAPIAALALLAACSTPNESFEPGKLSGDQIEICKRVERAYREQDPGYPAMRDAAVADPAVAGWLVRIFVVDVFRVRERQGVRDDDVLRAATKTDDEPAAARASAEIAALGDKAVPVLIGDLLQNPQPMPRELGIELLAKVGAPAVQPLKRIARDGQPQHRRAAARALGAIGVDAEVLALLRELAGSSDWAVRSDAMLGLLGGGDEARQLLLHHLRNDPDAYVRRIAVRSLAKFPSSTAANAIVDYLEESRKKGDPRGWEEAQLGLQAMAGTRKARSVEDWRAFANTLGDGRSGKPNEPK